MEGIFREWEMSKINSAPVLSDCDRAPRENTVFVRDDNSMVRVDFIRNGWVYFVSWRGGDECGNPIRMTVDNFWAAIVAEGMRYGQ